MRFRPEDRYRLLQSRLDAYQALEGVTITRRTALRWGTLASLLATVGCGDTEDPSDELDSDSLTETGGPTSADTSTTGASESGDGDGDGDGDATTSDTSGTTEESGETGQDPLTLEELMAIIHPWAVELVNAANPDDLSYNTDVEDLLKALVVDLPNLTSSGYDLEVLLAQAPVEIFEIHMAPHAVIPLHDHRDYIGAILGVEGSCDTVNYTQLTQPDQSGWFQVQEVAAGTVSAGVTGSLGLVDANLHVLTAGPQGAKLVDVFTFFDANGYSNWAELDPTPLDAGQGIYLCRWV